MIIVRFIILFLQRLESIGLKWWSILLLLSAIEVIVVVKKKEPKVFFRMLLWHFFVLYLLFILIATVFSRGTIPTDYNLISFDITTAWTVGPGQFGSIDTAVELVLNILMFLPFGCLLMELVKRPWIVLTSSLLFTLVIESLQLVLRRGFFELADILLNFVGAIFGLSANILYKRIKEMRNGKKTTT